VNRGAANVCVYVIMSHTNPEGIARLVSTIVGQSPASRVLIHHDAASGPFPRHLLADFPNVELVTDPVKVHWGTFTQVQAVLRSLGQLQASGLAYDWVTLISGQDYPARSIIEFEQMLANSNADAFITYERVTAEHRHLTDRYRFNYARVLPGPLPRIVRARQLYDVVLNRFQPLVRLQTGPRGTFVGLRTHRSVIDLPIALYKGWQWWALGSRAVDAVFRSVEHQPELLARYARTLIPDESFFQTAVVNTPGLVIRNESLHFADWRPGNPSPMQLTLRDLPAIRASGQWFARKIDAAEDDGLRDALDAHNRSASIRPAI
jgi:hypothetical protein